MLAFIFGLRLHRHGDALAAIRLIGGHVGIVAVDHRPVVAERGLVAAGGQSEGQCDEAGKGQRGGGSGTGVHEAHGRVSCNESWVCHEA